MSVFCPRFNSAIIAQNENGHAMSARTRCGSWQCPHCAPINAAQWRYRIYRGSEQLNIEQWSFFTITAHSKIRGAEAQWRHLAKVWSKTRKRLRRKFGAHHYVRVFERGTEGQQRMHMHVIASFWFDDIRMRCSRDGSETPYSPWLAKVLRKVGAGYITHAENMRSVAGASKYITKYLTKLGGAELPTGCRRIQASQKFPKPDQENEYEWEHVTFLTWRDFCERYDMEIYDLDLRRWLNSDDFERGYYPHREGLR